MDYCRKVLVDIKQEQLESPVMIELKGLVQKYPGDCQFGFRINGKDNAPPVLIISKTLRIKPDNRFMESLTKLVDKNSISLS